jgi:VWFA-related protein
MQAVRSEVMVFSIGLGRRLDTEYAREWTRSTGLSTEGSRVTQKEVLESLAVRTGGRLLLSPSPGKLRKAFGAVADDLRNQYSLAYEPPEDRTPGEYRRIEVSVPGREVQVIVRKGYYTAPDDAGGEASR